jgi:large subunit ribosomal protein L25
MNEVQNIRAEPRTSGGKGAARALRRTGRIPGLIYGEKKDNTLISVDNKELTRLLHRPGFFATLFNVNVDKATERVLPREVQFDSVTERPIHVDFLRVGTDTEIEVEVPVVFLHEEAAPGIKRGGLLNVVRHEIELVCRPDVIPHTIEIDLAGLDIGDSVHISDVKLPQGVRPTITDRDFTIATIAAPTVVQEEAAVERAEAEGAPVAPEEEEEAEEEAEEE